MSYDALDDFAGPGGWDEGARMLGLRFLGIDYDMAACLTATAAGHARICADVAAYPSDPFIGIPLYVGSPSCTLFSAAGSGVGRSVLDLLASGITRILRGEDAAAVRTETREAVYPTTLAEAQAKNAKRKPEKAWSPDRVEAKARVDAVVACLVLEPARRIVEMGPERVALEQVPEVLPLWQVYRNELRTQGWSTWCGVLCAADFGVPQTRRRAIFMGSRVSVVTPPTPTHAEQPGSDFLFGPALEKWVSMACALGWGASERPPWTLVAASTSGGRTSFDGGSGMRRSVAQTIASGKWVVDRRTNSKGARGSMVPTVPVSVDRPAPTLTGKSGTQWVVREDLPAWTHERPATTIVGSFSPDVVAAPGYHTEESRQNAPGSVSVSVSEAGVLQSFRDDYPWQGSRSKQYEQVGNAVPPLLAAHVLAALTGAQLDLERVA